MYYTYVLKSDRNFGYYIGYSSDVELRLKTHNSGTVIATKNLRPWRIFYVEEFQDEKDARARERQIKSWKSRNAIEKLIFNKNRGSSIS